MQKWWRQFIEHLRSWPWWLPVLIVWLILGPGFVLFYNTMWGMLGSQRAVFLMFGPLALAVGMIVAIVLYHYFRDRD